MIVLTDDFQSLYDQLDSDFDSIDLSFIPTF